MVSIWIWFGLALSIAYLSMLIFIGKYGADRTIGTVSDYFVASGSLSTLLIFLTMIGSAFSSGTFLGAIGLAYTGGLSGIISIAGVVIADVPVLVIVGEKVWMMSKKGKDYVTPADLLADRYDDSSGVRVLTAIISAGFTFLYVIVQFVGMGLVLTVLSNGLISRRMAIVIIGAFMLIYISIGGMRGVVYTDALQSVMLWVGMITVTVWVVLNAPADIYINAVNQMPSIMQINDPIYLYSVGFGYGLSIITYPYLWQRFFSSGRHSSIWAIGIGEAVPMIILSTIIPIVAGFAGIVMYPGVANGDTVILRMVLDMPGPLLGVIMVAALAAAMSSADSQILLTGSIVVRDIFQELPIIDITEEQMTGYSKWVSAGVTILGLVVSLLDLRQLMNIVLQLAVPGFLLLLPPLVAAFWWPQANKYGTIAGLGLGLISTVYFTFIASSVPFGLWVGLPGFTICAGSLIVVSLLTPQDPDEKIDEFVHGIQDINPRDLENRNQRPASDDGISTDD